MKTYLVEVFLPRSRVGGAADAAALLRATAERVSREGWRVRYRRSFVVPEDETCFHVYDADDEEAVRDACEAAGLASLRIVEARETAGDRDPCR